MYLHNTNNQTYIFKHINKDNLIKQNPNGILFEREYRINKNKKYI